MATPVEFKERLKSFYKFSRREVINVLLVGFITALIFSFRDWGSDQFSLATGLTNFIAVGLVIALTFIVRISLQKIYAIGRGYEAEFTPFWAGVLVMFLIALVSNGRIPLVLVGGMTAIFIAKQRLGEFRYGLSFGENGVIAMWGIYANMILAIIFAIGLLIFPSSYILNKGLLFNLVWAWCSLIPLPQLTGLKIYFGDAFLYTLAWVMVPLATILLVLLRSKVTLIIAVIIGMIAAFIGFIISSEK